jgi:hypothetical protein
MLQGGAQFRVWGCEWDGADGTRCSKVLALEPIKAGMFVFEGVGMLD